MVLGAPAERQSAETRGKGRQLPKVMYRLIEADLYIKKILVVGGGDTPSSAAMGLRAPGWQCRSRSHNNYRKESLHPHQGAQRQRIHGIVRKGKVKMIFNSVPWSSKENSVVLEVDGKNPRNPNDFVWNFAGGEPSPRLFLRKSVIGFGVQRPHHPLAAKKRNPR